MFFRPDEPHGLPHNPFNALIVPRPIGWISTLNGDGVANLAPYSFFNGVAYNPPQVMYASTGNHLQGGAKDSIANIRDVGEFVVNIASSELREQMNLTCIDAPHDEDEFALAGLTQAPSQVVKVPRVAESPAQLECRLTRIVELPTDNTDGSGNFVVFGEVVGIHISDDVLTDGKVDYTKLNPLSRLGYKDYGLIGEVFPMERPKWPL